MLWACKVPWTVPRITRRSTLRVQPFHFLQCFLLFTALFLSVKPKNFLDVTETSLSSHTELEVDLPVLCFAFTIKCACAGKIAGVFFTGEKELSLINQPMDFNEWKYSTHSFGTGRHASTIIASYWGNFPATLVLTSKETSATFLLVNTTSQTKIP